MTRSTKASELREADRVDFTFTISTSVSQHTDSTGFEKYKKEDGRTWLMDDVANHVNVEIIQTVEVGQNFIEIQVFSSV
ncbi:hypothetical protein AAVH_09952 [Aphelenchoides avenae]|nr:hypothetical protein AAVH_09952 [Aphelenchus avenae]